MAWLMMDINGGNMAKNLSRIAPIPGTFILHFLEILISLFFFLLGGGLLNEHSFGSSLEPKFRMGFYGW